MAPVSVMTVTAACAQLQQHAKTQQGALRGLSMLAM